MPSARMLGLGLIVLGLGIGALVPVFLAVYPAAGIAVADAGRPELVLPVFAASPALVTIPAILEIVVHAIGAVAIFGLWARFGAASFLFAVATLGGLAWMSVDIIDNAIALNVVPSLASAYVAGDEAAAAALTQLTALTDAIRLAGHFVGGLWMIGVSVFGIRGGFGRWIGVLGIVVGVIFAGNVFWPALLNVSFMTVPLWLVVAGIAVAVRRGAPDSAAMPSFASA